MFQKAYEGHLAVPVQNLLHPVTRFTRNLHSKSFIPPQQSKDVYKHSFFPQAVNDWNALSESTIQITDPAAFKAQISELYI